MKTFFTLLIVILCFFSHKVNAQTAAVQTTNTPRELTISEQFTFGNNMGWSFTVGSNSLTLSALGLYDAGGDGFAESHPIGLWTSTGILVSSTHVPFGTTAPLIGSYRYGSITPILLNAGQTYVIGTWYQQNSADAYIMASTQTFSPHITFVASQQNLSDNVTTPPFGFPGGNPGRHNEGFFGPNFQFVPPPDLSINDVTQNEGNSGQTIFTFTVSLSAPADYAGVSFNLATSDGTTNPATQPSDYTAVSGPYYIPPGSSELTVNVLVNGDNDVESDETFLAKISNVTAAVVADGEGLGTILNDDAYDPCANITPISCETPVTFSLSGSGIWTLFSCFYNTYGKEKIYSFTATTTGLHQIQVTASSGGLVDYFYKAASGGCSSTGWICAGGSSGATFGPLTAGVTYYILVDPNQTIPTTGTFQIICPVDPCLSIPTISCGVPVTSNHSGPGAWSVTACGYNTPGQEKVYSFTPAVTGIYNLEITPNSGTYYIDYFYKAASDGCDATDWNCIGTTGSATSFSIGTLTGGNTYYIMLKSHGTVSTSHTFKINCPAGPCNNIQPISCAAPVTVTASGTGMWDIATRCNGNTPGQEQIYSFTPPVTGNYSLQVTAASGGYGDYFYKEASDGCNPTGWTCVAGSVNGPQTQVFGPLTAGTMYYIVFDPEVTTPVTQTFQINCPADPCNSIQPISCATPVTSTHTGGGVWEVYACGSYFSQRGQERIYSFIPATSGPHVLEVTATGGGASVSGYIHYFYKLASAGCNTAGWTCISMVGAAGSYPIGTLTAGTTYYILLDESGVGFASQTFQITCPPPPCPSPVITNANTCSSVASATVHSLTGVPAGALLVLTTTNNTNAAPYNAIVTSSPSLTWTKRVDAGAASSNNAEIWTAVYAAGGNITVTSNWGAVGQASVLYTVTGAESVLGGASGIGTSQTAPSVAVTTTRANSILFSCTSDWNGINGATRTLRDGATDRYYFRDAAKGYTAYYYTKATTSAGTYTEGVSSPTGQKASTAVLEIRCPGTTAPDVTAPTIISVSPVNNATGVPVNTMVTATFSEAMNAATINGTTFELRNPSSVLVAATVTYNSGTNTATLTPSSALANSTTYTAKVIGGAPGVKDVAGNPMAGDYTWSFTTAAAAPACQPTVVSLDTKTNSAATVHSLTGVPAGALLVLTTTNNTNAAPYDAIVTSSPSLTWTKRVDAGAASSNNAEIWTAAFAAGGNITVTSNWGAAGQASVLYTVTGAEPVLGGASNIGTSQTAPSVAVTTTRANSILFGCTSDWNGINGATRTLRDGATDRFYFRDAAKGYTAYYYTKATTSAGTYTEGVSSPTGQKASTAVLEIRCPDAAPTTKLANTSVVKTPVYNYNLGQNYPNPVNSETTIQFTLPKAEKVNLSLYDINGRVVKVLVNGSRDAGTHTVSFNAGSLAGGVYYYRMKAGDFIAVKKIMVP